AGGATLWRRRSAWRAALRRRQRVAKGGLSRVSRRPRMGAAPMVSRLGTDVQHSAGVPQVVAPTALAERGDGVYQEIAGRIVEPHRRGVTEGRSADEPNTSGFWTAKIAASMFEPTTHGLDAEFFRRIPISVVK